MQSQQQVATTNNLNRNHVLMAPPPYPVQGQCTHSCPYHCGQFFQPPLGYSNLPPIQPIHTQSPYHPPSASYPLPNAAPLSSSSSGLPYYSAPVVAPPASGSTSSTPTNSSLYHRSVRPKRRSHGVMTIGDIIDRLNLFDAAKGRGLSKNRACASIEISKGTVGTYQMRVNEARRYGIELSEFRDFKWRDFRQVFRMTVSQSGLVTEEGQPSKSSTSASETGSNKLSSTATTSGSDGDLLDKKLSERSDSLLDESIQLSITDHLLGPHILSQLKLSLEPHRLNLHHLINAPSSPTNSAQPLTYPSTPTPTSSTPSNIAALNTLSITDESTVVNSGQPSSHPTPTRSSASKKRRRSTTMNLAVANGHMFDDEEDVIDSDAGVGADLDSVDDDSDYVDEEVTSKATSTLLHPSTTTSLPHAPTNRTTLPVQPIPPASTDTTVNAIESIKPHKLESVVVSELLKVEPISSHAPLKDDGSHDPSLPKVTPSSSDAPTCSSASTPISNGNVTSSSFQPFHHSSFHPPPPPPPRPPQPMPPPHHAMHHTHSHPLPPQSSGVTHPPFSIPSHSFHYPMAQPNSIPWQHSHPLQPHPHAISHQPTPPPPPPPHFIPYPSVSPSFHPSYPPLHPSHTPMSFTTRTINTPQTTHTHTMMLPPNMRTSMVPSSSHTHTQILTHLSPHPSPLIHSNSSSTHILSSAFAPSSLAPIKLESN